MEVEDELFSISLLAPYLILLIRVLDRRFLLFGDGIQSNSRKDISCVFIN